VKGFDEVLHTRAAASNPEPDLRIYGAHSEFSGLVGRPAASVQQSSAPALVGGIAYPEHYAAVDPGATQKIWTYLSGRIPSGGDRTVAVAVNGVIGGIARTYDEDIFGGSAYFAVLPPRLFDTGPNQIDVYAVSGSPGAPVLRPVKAAGG
jgi:hypothetical protein